MRSTEGLLTEADPFEEVMGVQAIHLDNSLTFNYLKRLEKSIFLFKKLVNVVLLLIIN